MSGASSRLLHATSTASFARRFRSVHERFGVFEQGLPTVTPEADLAVHLSLGGELLDRKVVALRAHASQTTGLIAAMGEDLYREWCAEESFLSLPSTPPWAAGSPLPPAAVSYSGRTAA